MFCVAEADPMHLQAIDIGERTLDPDHPDFAVWLGNRMSLLEKQVRAYSDIREAFRHGLLEVGVLAGCPCYHHVLSVAWLDSSLAVQVSACLLCPYGVDEVI